MPELGKATYWLVLNSEEYDAGLKDAQKRATAATNSIAKSFGIAEQSIRDMGPAAEQAAAGVGAAATEVKAAAGEISSSMEGAAATTGAASGEMVAAQERVGASAVSQSTLTAGAWRKTATSIAESAKSSARIAGFAALGFAYEMVKSGIETLKANITQTTLLTNAVHNLGYQAQSMAVPHMLALAKTLDKTTISTHASILEMEQMLLRFHNIRNVGPGVQAIFDRAVIGLNNFAIATGKNGATIARQLGKALQDPAKFAGALGRMGVTFTKQQLDQMKKLQTQGSAGFVKAQEMVLSQVQAKYKGAAVAVTKSAAGQLAQLRKEWDENSAAIVAGFIPAAEKLIKIGVKISEWMKEHGKLVRDVLLGYLAFKGVMAGLGVVLHAAGVAMNIFKFAMAGSGIGAVVLAVGALAAAMVLAVKYPSQLEHGLEKMGLSAKTAATIVMDLREAWTFLETTAIKVYKDLRPIIIKLGTGIMNFVEALIGFIRKHWDTIKQIILPPLIFWYNQFKRILGLIGDAFQFLADLLKGKWSKVWSDIEKIVSDAWSIVYNYFKEAGIQIGNVFIGILNAFIFIANKLIGYAAQAAASVVNGFISAYNDVSDALGGVLGHIGKVTFNWGIGYIGMMGGIGSSAGNAFASGLSKGLTALQGVTIASGGTANVPVVFEGGKWRNAATGVPLSPSEQKQATDQWMQSHGASKSNPFGKSSPSEGDQTTLQVSSGSSKQTIHVTTPKVSSGSTIPPYAGAAPPGSFTNTPVKPKKGKKPKKPSQKDIAMGSDWTRLQLAVQKALQTKTLADDMRAYTAEEIYLKKRIATGKYHGKLLLDLETALTKVKDEITKTRNAIINRRFKDEMDKLQIQLIKAELTNDPKKAASVQARIDKLEIKIINQEEDALRARIKRAKGDLDLQRQLYQQLLELQKKKLALMKAAQYQDSLTAKEMLTILEDRGTFFSQFAGNIFGGTAGNLSLQPNTGAGSNIQHHWMGGVVQRYAGGGVVPGRGTGDTVPAMLTPGELVLNARQQRNLARIIGRPGNVSGIFGQVDSARPANLDIDQHNYYSEIPRNRHHQADRLRRAAASAFVSPA